jgi:hypothetical protein
MKRVIRLTESDLTRIVKKIINERTTSRGGCRSGDCQNGKGRQRYANSDTYYGDFKNGHRDGFGRYTWYDSKKVYEGQWKESKMNGKGTFVYSSGSKEGSKETGNMINDKREGDFKYTNKNGVTTKVKYRNDELQGTTYDELNAKTKEGSTSGNVSGIGLYPKDQAEGDAFREFLNQNKVIYEDNPNSDQYGMPLDKGPIKCSDGRPILKPSENPGKVLPYKGPCIQEKWKQFGGTFRYSNGTLK